MSAPFVQLNYNQDTCTNNNIFNTNNFQYSGKIIHTPPPSSARQSFGYYQSCPNCDKRAYETAPKRYCRGGKPPLGRGYQFDKLVKYGQPLNFNQNYIDQCQRAQSVGGLPWINYSCL